MEGKAGGTHPVPRIFSVLGRTGTQTQGVLHWRTERTSLLLSQLYTEGRFGKLSLVPCCCGWCVALGSCQPLWVAGEMSDLVAP